MASSPGLQTCLHIKIIWGDLKKSDISKCPQVIPMRSPGKVPASVREEVKFIELQGFFGMENPTRLGMFESRRWGFFDSNFFCLRWEMLLVVG